jgi:phospholipase/carboxylesterase
VLFRLVSACAQLTQTHIERTLQAATRDYLRKGRLKQGISAKASLEHVVFYPSMAAKEYAAIVALHGRGTDEYDLLPLVEALGLDNVLVVSPRAPLSFSPVGFAWYEIGDEEVQHSETFQRSVDLLRCFLGEIKIAYPIDPKRLVLLGFSQGTVIAYAAGLPYADSIRGIAALSGYVPGRVGLQTSPHGLNGFPVFVSHGAYDEVIPVELGRESARALKAAGADVAYHEYQMGHEVREETLRDLSIWIRRLLH